MDWERDDNTFSDTNIEYIWRFLRVVHDRGWLRLRACYHVPRDGAALPGIARRQLGAPEV